MSRNMKIALIVIGSLTVFCIAVCAVGAIVLPRVAQQAFSTNSNDAKQVGASIADYTLPTGYTEKMGMNFLFEKLVMIGPSNTNNGMYFMLMQISTPNANRDDMQKQMQQAFSQQFSQRGGQLNSVGQETVMIRGQQVPLSIYETSDTHLQQAVGTFDGKNGLVMVMVMGSANEWDEDLMKSFLGSIQ